MEWPVHGPPDHLPPRSPDAAGPIGTALEAWERRDDDVDAGGELADVLTGRKGTALEASEGCSVAAAALAADDDEMIRDSVMAHAHDGCGWSFPDEPEPGH